MSPQTAPRITTPVEPVGETTLMIRRCRSCARLLAPLITTCTSCHSMALDWVRSSGDGSIVSWKVVHRVPCDRRFEEWEPSIIAIVELDEGPWVYTTIEGEIPPPSDQPVRVKFEPRPAGDRFPVFATSATGKRHQNDDTSPDPRPGTDPGRLNRGLAR